MSVLKDAVVVCHSILVMLALRYLLQEQKVIDCEERYCASVENNQVGNVNSYGEGFMSSWITNEEAQERKTPCLCCKVSHQGCWSGFCTFLATLHLVISVAVVFLKHKTFNSFRHIWVYIILIIATVINTLLLTRLIRSDTHQNPVTELKKEGILWKVFSMPFRIVWNALASVLGLIFYNEILTSMLGWFRCYQNSVRTPVMFLCSLDRNTMLSLNVMIQHAVCTLSWTYVVSAVVNIYSLMKSLGKEQLANNNRANDKQEKKNSCRLCREILAAKRRKTRDFLDSEDSDNDSFVLGWRL